VGGVAGLVVFLGAFAMLASACGGSETKTRSPARPGKTRAAKAQKPLLSQLVARVRSGVVRVEVETCEGSGVGTGFLLGPRLVASVEHVVDGAVRITLKRGGKALGSATVIGSDAARDLALLRTARPLSGSYLKLASRPPRLGEEVVALGYPLGLPLSVTRGLVSGTDRTIPIEGVNRRRLVQTDAAVNFGNSGGPLISAESGEVVGIVDLGTTEANGIAFAVSAEVAAPLLQAWRLAPQPVRQVSCARTPPPADKAEGLYAGNFAAVDRLEVCYADDEGAVCAALPSGKGVRLVPGSGAAYLGIVGGKDEGGPAMPLGTSFSTPQGTISCDSSYRGIRCRDNTTGSYFVIGDYRVVINNGRGEVRY